MAFPRLSAGAVVMKDGFSWLFIMQTVVGLNSELVFFPLSYSVPDGLSGVCQQLMCTWAGLSAGVLIVFYVLLTIPHDKSPSY